MVLRLITAACWASVAGLVFAPVVAATPMTVNSTGDAIAASGPCTLREAILASNTQTASGGCPAGNGDDTITLAVSKVTLAIPGASEDADHTGDLDVTGKLTIQGQPGGTTISAAGLDRVLDVRSSAQLTVQDVTLTGGVAPAGLDSNGSLGDNPEVGVAGGPGEDGGAVRNAGVMVLRRVTITGNTTSRGGTGSPVTGVVGSGVNAGAGGGGGSGGGIASSGSLTVSNSTISGNTTGAGGNGGDGTAGFATGPGLDGQGGAGGRGGDGGGIYTTGISDVADSVITGNRTGAGGLGGNGHGSNGASSNNSANGRLGGEGAGGLGGSGGAGGGVDTSDGALRITGSLVSGNATGDGAAGGLGFGGGGGAGEIAGTGTGGGGTGGTAVGGRGGSGGVGGGLAAARRILAATPAVVATSDTVTANSTGRGAGGGASTGGPGGRAGGTSNGGPGGTAFGGGGGNGGDGGGAGQDFIGGTAELTLFGATVVQNTASTVAGAAVVGAGGLGGFSGGGTDGANGSSISGIAGNAGRGGIAYAVVANSIIAGNTPTQCLATTLPPGAQGYNVSFPDVGCPGVVLDPMLGPLGDNGGPTSTFALLPGSPAIDEVPATGAGCPTMDQRGVARPQGTACDAGAYEHAPPGSSTGSATTTDTAAMITASVNPNQRATTVHFVWGTTADHVSQTADQTLPPGATAVAVSAGLTGLAPGTTYHYAVVATNADGTSTGADETFTTTVPAGPGPGPGGSVRAPVLSKLALRPSAFLPVSGTHRTKRGTTISYTDSAAAKTTFTVQHAVRGVRSGKRCVTPPKHHRKAATKPRPCTRLVLLRGSFTHVDRPGANTVQWSGMLGGKPLPPGSYRLLARPTLAGVAGAPVEHAFTIKHA